MIIEIQGLDGKRKLSFKSDHMPETGTSIIDPHTGSQWKVVSVELNLLPPVSRLNTQSIASAVLKCQEEQYGEKS